MRKKLLILTVCIIFQSCWSESNTYIQVVSLQNDKSLILNNVNTPYFDTLYQWKDVSDNYCDDKMKRRLSSKNRPIEMESGFIYAKKVFEVKQVTITEWNKACKKNNRALKLEDELYRLIKQRRENLEEAYLEGAIKIIIESVEHINGQVYGVLGGYFARPEKSDECLNVLTIIEGDLIGIDYECCCQECEGFAKKMLKDHLTLIKVK